ncbi:MAG: tRNA pseudouridine synthase B [Pelotomaculum sp. PtaB.Bin117]|nr:MAG: tRNA pseudouridine synthase B [Pelotomaculum sp. PtaB.Bin117]OPY62687.1 MAG: tRNA pseudouridine synthase B [Pelotomaculum sp. PtaU1.Bin065]
MQPEERDCDMNGIINVLKPPGMTSHDVVDFIRRTFKINKVGHTGTLDPGAAGVLVVCLGRATRAARFIAGDDKEYRAEITFGTVTSTGDSFGEVIGECDASYLTAESVKASLPVFTGEISQVPPMVSALKWHGKKLYELARAGLTVERRARAVTINKLDYIDGAGWGGPKPVALVHLTCSKGTYVRTLCEDIGDHLGCGAHMSFLVRTRAGVFEIADSCTLEDIKSFAAVGKAGNNASNIIIPVEEALLGLPPVRVKSAAVAAVSSGSKLFLPGVAELPDGLTEGVLVRLQGPEGLLAVAETGYDPADPSRLVFKTVCVLV